MTQRSAKLGARLAAAMALLACLLMGAHVRADAPAQNDPVPRGEPAARSGSAAPLAAAAPFPVYTDPGALPQLRIAGAEARALPLEHTHVKARLAGYIAEVEVRQTYRNPSTAPIEAHYVFPLPENSAVNGMRMVIGKRVIEAKIDRRQAAKRIYEQAKRRGHTAALLEQERPNVFTQSVANIAPGTKIDVVVSYLQDLSYDAGWYEFVFPMVVGPRYFPGGTLEGPNRGSGTHADTTRVIDASRISPPYLGRGERNGANISIELSAQAGVPIQRYQVPTHEVVARQPADGSLHVSLAEKRSLPNRDFVLRYRVAAPEPQASLLLSPAGPQGGFFTLMVQPPALDIEQLVGRRELIFVVDVSGSMHGVPLGVSKAAMRRALQQLRPVDTFNIITFAGRTARAFARPRPASRVNIARALQVVDGLRAGGGTEMRNAVGAALGDDVAPGRHRYVMFLTDGYIGNEKEIFAAADRFVSALEGRGQRARVFAVGVGSSVNRHLIDGLSKAGKALPLYANTREGPERAVKRWFGMIDRPVLTNLAIDWGTMRVDELMPAELPELYASRPAVLHGRYRGKPSTVTASAQHGGQRIRMAVRPQLLERFDGHELLGTLWAREKIGWLERELWQGPNVDVDEQITKLGLRHRLVTRLTSFVAVDVSRTVGDGAPELVRQPVAAPEGVDVGMAGGVDYEVQPASEPMAAEDMDVDGFRACGCRLPGAPAGSARGLWIVAIAFAAARSRRRRRPRR
jgi:Ca-activated chloride channel family protein